MNIKVPDKWKKILSKIASKDKLLIFLLAGVLLIIINIPVKSSTAKAKNSDTTVKETQADNSYYISALEKELSQAPSAHVSQELMRGIRHQVSRFR